MYFSVKIQKCYFVKFAYEKVTCLKISLLYIFLFLWVTNIILRFLIQNFVAEAATAAQNATAAQQPQPNQAYNPYPGHAPPAYPSQPPPAAHAPPGADYGGPVYGGSYGY